MNAFKRLLVVSGLLVATGLGVAWAAGPNTINQPTQIKPNSTYVPMPVDRTLQVLGNIEGTGPVHHFGQSFPLQTSGVDRVQIGQPADPYASPLTGIAEGEGLSLQVAHAPAGAPSFSGLVWYRRNDNDVGNQIGGDIDFGANIPNQGENSTMIEAWGSPFFSGLSSTALVAYHDGPDFVSQWLYMFDGTRKHPAWSSGSQSGQGWYYDTPNSTQAMTNGTVDLLRLDSRTSDPFVDIPVSVLNISDAQHGSGAFVQLQRTIAPTAAGQTIGATMFVTPTNVLVGAVASESTEAFVAGVGGTRLVFNNTQRRSLGSNRENVMIISDHNSVLVGTPTDDVYEVDVHAPAGPPYDNGPAKGAIAARTISSNLTPGANQLQAALTVQNLDSTNNNWSTIPSLSSDGNSDAIIGFQHIDQTNHYGEVTISERGADGMAERFRCSIPASDGLVGLWVSVHTGGASNLRQIKADTEAGGKRILYVDP